MGRAGGHVARCLMALALLAAAIHTCDADGYSYAKNTGGGISEKKAWYHGGHRKLLMKHWGHRVAYDEIKQELAGVGAAAGPAAGGRFPILEAAARNREAEAIAASTGHPIPANVADIASYQKGGKVKGGKENKTATEKAGTNHTGGARAPSPAAGIAAPSTGGAEAMAPAAMEQPQQGGAQTQGQAATPQGQPAQGALPPAEAQQQQPQQQQQEQQPQNQSEPGAGGGAQGQPGPTRHLLQSSRSQNVGRPEPDETSSELYRGAGAPAPGAASPAEMAEEEAPGRRLLQKAVIDPVTGQNMDGEGPAHRRTLMQATAGTASMPVAEESGESGGDDEAGELTIEPLSAYAGAPAPQYPALYQGAPSPLPF